MTSNDPLSGVYVKGEDDPRILLNFNPVKITNQNTGQLDEHRYLGTDLTVADELTEYYNSQAQDESIPATPVSHKSRRKVSFGKTINSTC